MFLVANEGTILSRAMILRLASFTYQKKCQSLWNMTLYEGVKLHLNCTNPVSDTVLVCLQTCHQPDDWRWFGCVGVHCGPRLQLQANPSLTVHELQAVHKLCSIVFHLSSQIVLEHSVAVQDVLLPGVERRLFELIQPKQTNLVYIAERS
jgi:hypothetical protein